MGGTFSNNLINNTIYHLLNFEKYSNFQMAAREAAINNNFQMVVLSEDFNPVFTVETRHKKSVEEVVRKGIERGAGESRFTMIDVEGVQTYWGPVGINGIRHYLLLVDNEGSYSQDEISRLAEILELAMGMWKYSPVRDVTAEFIKALRRGNRSLAYTLKEEAGLNRLIIKSVLSIAGIDKEECFKLITHFEKKTGLRVLKIAEGDEVCCIILCSEDQVGIEEQYWAILCETLETAGGKMIFYVNGIDSIESAAEAFQLINEAWPFMNHIFPRRKIFTKYELTLAGNCINISLKGGMVKKYYIGLLEPLKKLGENKGKQLLDTLGIFILDADMKTSITSKIMNLHINTVQYRLKRIKEVLGVDITQTTVIPGLLMALALERIETIVRAL